MFRTLQQTRLRQGPYSQHLHQFRAFSHARTVVARAGGAVSVIPNHEIVVAGVLLSAMVHHVFMPFHIVKARKKYGVSYPALYATKDMCESEEDCNTYNCIQRGHQNSLEMQPIFLALFMVSAVQHPMFAGVCALVYCLGRVVYMLSYKTGDPNKRADGAKIFFPALFALIGVNAKILGSWAASCII